MADLAQAELAVINSRAHGEPMRVKIAEKRVSSGMHRLRQAALALDRVLVERGDNEGLRQRSSPFDIVYRGGEKPCMELSDLTRDERVALAALLELVVESNANVSDDELKEVKHVVSAVGDVAYAEAADEAAARFRDEADLKAFLPSITRQEAREVIYGAVLETALPDAMGAHESAMLNWLGKAWGIAVRIEDSGSGDDA